ncbi:MAG: metallophosphatase domain-containing protein [Thermoanaerobaculia bacterium]
MVRVVCLSDTHNCQGRFEVPEGDLLVHAGDLTGRGTVPEVAAASRWLASLPHPHKIVVAGNHDFLFEREAPLARSLVTGAVYLEDSGVGAAGLSIWGSPWQPWFYDWAFNLPRGPALREKWARIPEGLDILVTHGPPAGILDVTAAGEAAGCEELADRLASMRRPPRLHVFGHIHEGYGVVRAPRTTFVNASVCDVAYRPINRPIVIDLA